MLVYYSPARAPTTHDQRFTAPIKLVSGEPNLSDASFSNAAIACFRPSSLTCATLRLAEVGPIARFQEPKHLGIQIDFGYFHAVRPRRCHGLNRDIGRACKCKAWRARVRQDKVAATHGKIRRQGGYQNFFGYRPALMSRSPV